MTWARYGRPVSDWRHDRIGSALRGENPSVIAKLPRSFAVMGDLPWLPGYCVLLVDAKGIGRLSDLDAVGRREFLASMARLGEAVEKACSTADPEFRRVNLEILGNSDEFLHAHIWPRYRWEPAHLVDKPVWLYPPEFWTLPTLRLGPQQDELRAAIAAELAAP